LIFALSRTTHGAQNAVVHELEDGSTLVWELLDEEPPDALLAARVAAVRPGWLMRHDRVDFPAGAIAYRHTHPGPGIRYLLHGRLRIEAGGEDHTYGPGEAWFESGPEPVLATASESEETAFVRVLLLPPDWAGKRTIRYVDPADEDRPKLQRPTVFGEYPVAF
jgi:quercetin dioxygenase-like cupin family protein